jgi:hypothetical protein
MSVNILHIISHTQLTLSALPWEPNVLLFGRPLLVSEYRTITKSVRPTKAVSKKLIYCVWSLSARIVIFLMMAPIQFYLERWSP